MPVLDIFSECAKYKYKTNICSYGTLLVIFATTASLSIPIIIVHLTGGFWIRNDVYTEIPDVIFKHKYLLIAESMEDTNPVICTTFRTYKDNRISDSCAVTKVQELDINRDGLNDVLKFELRFFAKFPIHTVRLLLFFNYELKERGHLTMEAMTALHYTIPLDVQKIFIVGELRLNQKILLHNYGIHDIYNHSTDLNEHSLFELLTTRVSRKFTVEIENVAITWERGSSAEEETVIRADLIYPEEVINYRPDVWEELKWAWIQYFAFFFVFAFAARHLTQYAFVNRYIRSYVISPWDKKSN